jgi:hypothetical protein
MRPVTLLLLSLLAACSAGGPKVGTVFSPNPSVVTCPTKEMLGKITKYAAEKDEKDYKAMLLDGGGLCTPLPAQATLTVAEVDGKMIRVRPERSPGARGVWTYQKILSK